MQTLSARKRELIEKAIDDVRRFRFCGPSDDLDAQTAVTLDYRHLVVQLQRLVSPILPKQAADRLVAIDVETNNLFSAFDASNEIEALLPDIEDELEAYEGRSASVPVVPEALKAINHEAVAEHIAKANAKIEEEDFSGAITNAYTLVEQLLKLLLAKRGLPYKPTDGDIRSLYNTLRRSMQLDPADDGIAAPLRPILDGLQRLVGGLYEVANSASDRHVRRYNPARRHAKLAVSAALALCEFLVESHEYQKHKDKDGQDNQ